MDLEDQKAKLKQRLLAAPKRERSLTFAALLRSMRHEIAKVCKEKNLSYKDIQQMLAADGLDVSIATLRRHLGEKRKGRAAERSETPGVVNLQPAPAESAQPSGAAQAAPMNNSTRSERGATRPIPPMPSPIIRAPEAAGAGRSDDRSVPRASSFPIRRDREQI
jgi:DNA-binding protein H-NS